MKSPVSHSDLIKELEGLSGWRLSDNKLVREFRFSDFVEAFAFMTEMAMVSEQMNHHPEWNNCFNVVSISLTTHDAHGVTEKDIQWATTCNQRYNQKS